MLELETSELPEPLLARLRVTLPTPLQWRNREQEAKSLFYGRVKASGFWVMVRKAVYERNMFNPVLVAWVAPSQRGSRITATVRVPLPIQAFLAAWCVGACGLGAKGLYDAMTSPVASDRQIIPIFAVAIPILLGIAAMWYALARITMKQRRPQLEQWLREFVTGADPAAPPPVNNK